MTYGTLQPATRTAIIDAVAVIDEPEFRVKAAIYLMFVSADYAVQL